MFVLISICYTCYTGGVDSVRGEAKNRLIFLLNVINYDGKDFIQ